MYRVSMAFCCVVIAMAFIGGVSGYFYTIVEFLKSFDTLHGVSLLVHFASTAYCACTLYNCLKRRGYIK